MKKSLRLALELRSRQYADLLLSCLLRPSSAARELVARPEQWRAGSLLLWLAWIASFKPDGPRIADILARGLAPALLLAFFCFFFGGAAMKKLRWVLWIELWGYSLAPLLITRLITAPLYAGIFAALPRPWYTCVIAPIFGLSVILIFAVLRLILNFVRAAADCGWYPALAISLLAFFGGVFGIDALESGCRVLLHG